MDPVKSLTARDWTVADAYALLPESGVTRYEVIDGELFVSPEASWRHQRRIFDLAVVLDAACPAGLRVSGGPINLDIGDRRHLEPDIAVKRVEDLDASESVPVLLVEVLSPSTWRHDTHCKREVYRDLGVPSFWLVDPIESIVTVLDLVDGDYVETARIGPGDVVEVTRPFSVRIAPGEWTLLD